MNVFGCSQVLKEVGRSSQCHDYSNVQGAADFTTALLPPPRIWERGISSTAKQRSCMSEGHCWRPVDKHHCNNSYNRRLSRTFFKWGGGRHWMFTFSGLSDWICSADLSWRGSLPYFSWWKVLPVIFFLNTFTSREIGFVRYNCRLVHATCVIWNIATEVYVLVTGLHSSCFCSIKKDIGNVWFNVTWLWGVRDFFSKLAQHRRLLCSVFYL